MVQTIKENAKLFSVYLIAILSIAMSLISSNLLSVIAFGIITVALFFFPIGDSITLLFGLLPFANIFKMGPGSTSLFTILEIAAVLFFILKHRRIHSSFIISLLFLFIFILCQSVSNLQPLGLVKIAIGFILIYFAGIYVDRDALKNIAYLMSCSVIVMLILSNIPQYYAHVQPYLADLDYYIDKTGHASSIVRNSGFIGDANYCALMAIMSLSLLCVLYYHKKVGSEFWGFISVILPMGFLTYSKSYFLCATVLILFLLLFVLYPKHKRWAIVATIVVAVAAYCALNGEIPVISMIFDRFRYDASLTTSRSTLNEQYLNYIADNSKVLFFGAGIFVDRFAAVANNVHNIYIELLFKMGLFGSVIYMSVILCALRSGNHYESKGVLRFVNCFPCMFFAVMYFFLAGILYYATPFYIIIANLALKYEKLPQRSVKIESN